MLAILDYEAGNQTSVFLALRSLGIDAKITADKNELTKADGVIFPGVGAARQAMNMLTRSKLDETLRHLVTEQKPLLGVCLGCQILLDYCEENDTKTLGIVPGRSVKFSEALRDEEGAPIIIPHMGWNGYSLKRPSPLFDGISPAAEFYFVHSYYVEVAPELVLATSYHGMEFCSAYGRDGFWAVQFHPEKSGKAGLRLLSNFYDFAKSFG